MKVLVIGDPHLKASSTPLVKRFLRWISDICQDEKIDLVVNLGDTFHTHNVIRSEVMALVTSHVDEVASKLEYVILVGNHDMAHHKTPDVHAWIPLMNRSSQLRIIDKPTSIDGMVFLPYIDSPDEFQRALDSSMQESSLIFCHQTFRGADYGFIKAKEGTVVPEGYSGLIVAGHIHKAQTMGPVWYPGTPFAQESADHDETKGIYLLDTVSREVTFIKSPLPQWVTVRATPDDYEQAIRSMDKNNRNHLVLTGPSSELQALMDTRLFRELKREYAFSVKKQSTVNDTRRSVRRVTSLEGAIVDYIDNIYQGSVDKELLKAQCLDSLR